MRIAALQMQAVAGDPRASLAAIDAAAADARSKGADVLVAPELAVPGYGAGDALHSLAEPADGPQVAALRDIARRHGIAVVAGFAERHGTSVFNAAAFVDGGDRTAIYRKRNLYGAYEKRLFAPGDAPAPRIALAGLRVGILICYDVEFPECTRALALAGVDAVLVPTALPATAHAAFIAEKMLPVRAFENQIAIVYANYAGADRRFAYAGRSCIVMPDGTEAARANATDPALLVADYRPDDYAESRAANPYLADLRG